MGGAEDQIKKSISVSDIFYLSSSFFFSYCCPFCKDSLIDLRENIACSSCISKLPFVRRDRCIKCGRIVDTAVDICSSCLSGMNKFYYDRCISTFEMDGIIRDAILSFKYNGDLVLCRPLAEAMCRKLLVCKDINVDMITYIPSFFTKYLYRGFNQSYLLARYISKRVNLPIVRLLIKIKQNKSQTKLKYLDRHRNIEDVFRVINKDKIFEKSILVVDDVFTTGATANEAARKLKEAGAKIVTIFTLAIR